MKILIIDNNKSYIKQISGLLINYCKNIEVATNKLEALKLIKKNHYDIILVESLIPGINEIHLFNEIKKISPDIKIIVNTDDNNLNNKKNAINCGIYAYYSKKSIRMLINDIELIMNGFDLRNQ